MARIVVGVDGSDGSRDALCWALRQATHDGAVVEAVTVFSYTAPGTLLAMEAMPVPAVDGTDLRREAEELLDATVARARQRLDVEAVQDVEVVQKVLEGPVARRLLERSRGADLLVVGSRGLGGFRGLLLGSVGHQAVSHATCPVVVMPHVDE